MHSTRKAATVATFASLVAGLTATLGVRFVDHFDQWWAVLIFIAGLVLLIGSVGSAVVTLLPREHLSLGIAYLERFPTWAEVRKPPEAVRGTTMRGLIETIARERQLNDRKASLIRASLVLLFVGLVLIALEGATLAIDEVRR
jgi:hypothetical protein